MKNILKTSLLLFALLFVSACLNSLTPSEKVEEFLNRYIKNDSAITSELDTYISKQNLSNEQKEKYKNIILNEYATLKYAIKTEKTENDEAHVQVDIEVNDLYKASTKAENYLAENPEEFYTDNSYDKDKFTDYKLETMEKESERIKYTIEIKLSKKDKNWQIEELSKENLEKIHGIYSHEVDET